jgi:hypothetical protein
MRPITVKTTRTSAKLFPCSSVNTSIRLSPSVRESPLIRRSERFQELCPTGWIPARNHSAGLRTSILVGFSALYREKPAYLGVDLLVGTWSETGEEVTSFPNLDTTIHRKRYRGLPSDGKIGID